MTEDAEKKTWYDEGVHFSCTQCGNCCTGPSGYVWYDSAESKAMAAHLGVSESEFRKRYAQKKFNRWTLAEVPSPRGQDCVFLVFDPKTKKAGCSIYEVRPAQCRTWPFWPENLRSEKAYRSSSSTCPGMTRGLDEQHGQFYPIEKIRVLRDATPS